MFNEVLKQSKQNASHAYEQACEQENLRKKREKEFAILSKEFVDKYYKEVQELNGKVVYIPYVSSIFDSWDSIPPSHNKTKVKVSRRDNKRIGSDIHIEFKGWIFSYASITLGADFFGYMYSDRTRYGMSTHGLPCMESHEKGSMMDKTFEYGESLMSHLKYSLAKLNWKT